MTAGKWPFELDGGLPNLAACESNSPLWRVSEEDGEPCIALLDNTIEDHDRGKTLIFGDPDWTDYCLELETKVIKGRMPNPLTAWWGFGLRAQDPYNVECFFFRPPASGTAGLAYVPIAHGLQPVWTDAYRTQQFGPADGAPCGYACIEERDDDFHIREIVVHPAYQNRGIGTAVLQETMERARARGVPVHLGAFLTNRAADLYRRLGFQETARTDTHIIMEWHPDANGATL